MDVAFKRQTPEADKVYCLTSAARRAIGILGGTVNGVSDSHRDTVKEYDPEVYAKPIYGVTNGNRQSLTSGEFNRVFIELFGSQKKKQILKIYKSELERLKGPQGNFERVKKIRELQQYLYKWVWAIVDNKKMTREKIGDMFKQAQLETKRQYFDKYIRPNLKDFNIRIPDEFKNNIDNFREAFIQLPWVVYTGRWVYEKWGLFRAFTDVNIKNSIELGIVYIILGNPQFYATTNEPPMEVIINF